MAENKIKKETLRHTVQILWTVATNSFVTGFLKGKIYTGSLKNLCVPGMNCYSCPGALGSCPIGALQSVISSKNYHFAFYVVGFIMLVGAVCGRFVCGWLCPFGLFQDLLHKIPFIRKIKTFKGDRILRKLKYIILALFVVILPMCVADSIGIGDPWFCKYICPVGTLEGGIPLVLLNESLRQTIGWLYTWKIAILVVLVVLSIIIYRPFCKYLCPLGAIYGAFNKISAVGIHCDKEKCISCRKCEKVCKMAVYPAETPKSAECIRCGLCVKECPTKALHLGTELRKDTSDKNCKSDI